MNKNLIINNELLIEREDILYNEEDGIVESFKLTLKNQTIFISLDEANIISKFLKT